MRNIYRFLQYKFGENFKKNLLYDDPLCCAYSMEQHNEVLLFTKEYKCNVVSLTYKDLQLCKHLDKVSHKLSNSIPTRYFNTYPHDSLEWINLHVNAAYEVKSHQLELDEVMKALRMEELALK